MLVALIFGVLFFVAFNFIFLVYIKFFEKSKLKKIIFFIFLFVVGWFIFGIDGLIIIIVLNVALNFMNKMGWIQNE